MLLRRNPEPLTRTCRLILLNWWTRAAEGEPLTVETTVDFHNGRVISDIEVCACAPGSLHLCICLLKSNV